MTFRRTPLGLGLALGMLVGGLLLLRPGEGGPGDAAEPALDEAARTTLRTQGLDDEAHAGGPVLRGDAASASLEAGETPADPTTGAIAGRVVHAGSWGPVTGVSVHAVSWGSDARVLACAVSADDGTYRLAGLPGDAWIGIEHRGVEFEVGLRNRPETFTLTGVPEGRWPVTLRWKRDGERFTAVVQGAEAGDTLEFDMTEAR